MTAEPQTEPQTGAPPAAGGAGGGRPLLEGRGLVKTFRQPGLRGRGGGKVHAVSGVTIELHQGRVVALVGESGSGKSTVARMLSGLEKLSDGEVLLDGQRVAVNRQRAFRHYKRDVQMIFQDPYSSLNPVHTIRHHLERPLRSHGRVGRGGDLDAALEGLLEQVRLTPGSTYLQKFPHELSGGQRQRVSIARALAPQPRVLLADEPVSMLDVSIRLGVLNLLDDLKERLHLAVLYITHDIASARYFADETLVMYAGEVVEQGPSEELTQHPAHPYTQLLLSSAPDPDRDAAGVTEVPRGAPPSLVTLPSGCHFHPRCPFAHQRCTDTAPPLVDLGGGRSSRCWLHLDGGSDTADVSDAADREVARPPGAGTDATVATDHLRATGELPADAGNAAGEDTATI